MIMMANAEPTLTKSEYLRRCAVLDAALDRATREFEARALVATSSGDPEKSRESRLALAQLAQERQTLDAAWRGAQARERALEDSATMQAKRAAEDAANRAIDEQLKCVSEIVDLTGRMHDLFERLRQSSRTVEQDVRGLVTNEHDRDNLVSGTLEVVRRHTLPMDEIIFGGSAKFKEKSVREFQDAAEKNAANARRAISRMLFSPEEPR